MRRSKICQRQAFSNNGQLIGQASLKIYQRNPLTIVSQKLFNLPGAGADCNIEVETVEVGATTLKASSDADGTLDVTDMVLLQDKASEASEVLTVSLASSLTSSVVMAASATEPEEQSVELFTKASSTTGAHATEGSVPNEDPKPEEEPVENSS